MSRWASVSRMGFFAFPEAALPWVANLFKPADFPGYMVDMCAGEGTALDYLSKAWNLTAYANELDKERYAKCVEKFGIRAIHGDFFDVSTHGGFSFGWINPPFQHTQQDKSGYNRSEQQFLAAFWGNVVYGGHIGFVCYVHHLANTEFATMLYNQCDTVDVYAVPGYDLGAYNMVVVIMKRRTAMRDIRQKDVVAGEALAARAEAIYRVKSRILDGGAPATSEEAELFFEDISTVTAPRYEFKNPHLASRFKMVFTSKTLSDTATLSIASEYGVYSAKEVQALAMPARENLTRRVVITPRQKQIISLLASGLFNGAVIQTETGNCIIRAVVTQVEREVKEPKAAKPEESDDFSIVMEDEPKSKTKTQKFQTHPETTITVLYHDGRIENITEDKALAGFIKAHQEQLMAYISRTFAADYKFDYIGGALKPALDNARIAKGKKRFPLYTTQKHVIAAMLAHLRTDKTVTVCGEMGTGKTSMGSAWMNLARYGSEEQKLLPAKDRMTANQFNIVTCPPHLVDKWANEIRGMYPDAFIGTVKSGEGTKPIVEVMAFVRSLRTAPATAIKVLVISREMGKVGESWSAAFVRATQHIKDTKETRQILTSPLTGLEIVQPRNSSTPRPWAESRLKNKKTFQGIDAVQKRFAKRQRGMKKTQFKGLPYDQEELDKKLEALTVRGRTKEANAAILNFRAELRQHRLAHDNSFSHHEPFWQEARSFSAMKRPVGEVLAERMGAVKKDGSPVEYVMPLPDLCVEHLAETEYHNPKSPRGPLEGVIKFLTTRYGHMIYAYICDEAHEMAAGDASAQGLMALTLAAKAKKVIYMTGTLYKGVASSLYYIEFATNAEMRELYPWGHVAEWVADMGAIERVVTTKSGADGKMSSRNATTERISEIPGASPELLRHVISHTIFVGITDLGKDVMPPYIERGTPVAMDANVGSLYKVYVEGIMKDYLTECLTMNDGSFLGAYFQAALNWANWPYDNLDVWHRRWTENPKTGEKEQHPVLVCTIPGIGRDVITSKEQKLIDMISASLEDERGVVVYFRQTGTSAEHPDKDMLKRIQGLIVENVPAAKTAVLRASVGTGRREAWLTQKKEDGVNVLLCNPNLVKTGLDLLEYPTIIWYELDFSLPTVDQASHRAWRPGQTKTCTVDFLFYVQHMTNNPDGSIRFATDTMEARGVSLVDAKRRAANFLYGRDGASLNAMNEVQSTFEDDMAKSLDANIIIDSSTMFQQASVEEVTDWGSEEPVVAAVEAEPVQVTEPENAQAMESQLAIVTPAIRTPAPAYCPGLTGYSAATAAHRYLRIADGIPLPGENDGMDIRDVQVRVKLFNPAGGDTWFVTEYDPTTRKMCGFWVNGNEYGPFEEDMNEFVSIRVPLMVNGKQIGALPMERDLHFTPNNLVETLRSEHHMAALAAFESFLGEAVVEEATAEAKQWYWHPESASLVEMTESELAVCAEGGLLEGPLTPEELARYQTPVTAELPAEPVLELVEDMPVAEVHQHPVYHFDLVKRAEQWRMDTVKYVRPIEVKGEIITFDAGNGRRITWQKNSKTEWIRFSLDGEVVVAQAEYTA